MVYVPGQLSSCQELGNEGLQALEAKLWLLLQFCQSSLRVVAEECWDRS